MSDVGKIKKDHSLVRADKILQELRKIWPKHWEGHLECWSNCREQGYYLQAVIWDEGRGERSEAACVFSECRNSDSALVVVGRRADFDFQKHQPSEALWESDGRAYFGDLDGIDQEWTPALRGRGDKRAAKWIVERLRGLLAADLEDFRKKRKAYEESLRQAD